ncbi:hypothetical protein [Eubacterium pyruvativorans]|uniref:hypothetical protein n=1 Tax=Eubacterium pyruvativorans TaxID=155865 RepID=UPI00115F846D|nr:hypothetical protein [Eubacterium pyruvativorans]
MAPKVRTGGSATTGQAAPPPRNNHDLEIGPITILGIYRGLFKFNDIRTKVDSIAKLNDTNENIASVQDVETDDKEDVDNSDSPYLGSEEMIHYIDVIALLQELS